MPRNIPLGSVRFAVKAEVSKALAATANADDAQINQVTCDVQQWLASEYDWPFLRCRWDLQAGVGSRYLSYPTTDDDGNTFAINFERGGDLKAYVKWNQVWQEVEYGIREMEEFNYIDSDRAIQLDPIQRWMFDDENHFEIWPIPASAQTLRFIGQRVLTPLTTTASNGSLLLQNAYTITTYAAGDDFTNVGALNNNQGAVFIATGNTPTNWTHGSVLTFFNDAATLDLDDLMVKYFVAAEYLARKEQDGIAKILMQKAQNRMAQIRATYPKLQKPCVIGGTTMLDRRALRIVPMVVVGGH